MNKKVLGNFIVLAFWVLLGGCGERTNDEFIVCEDSEKTARQYLEDNHLHEGFSDGKNHVNFVCVESIPTDCKSVTEEQLIALSEALYDFSSFIESKVINTKKSDPKKNEHESTIQTETAGLLIEKEIKYSESEEFSKTTIKKDTKTLLEITLSGDYKEKRTINTSYDEIIMLLKEGGINVNVLKTFRDKENTTMIFMFSPLRKQ